MQTVAIGSVGPTATAAAKLFELTVSAATFELIGIPQLLKNRSGLPDLREAVFSDVASHDSHVRAWRHVSFRCDPPILSARHAPTALQTPECSLKGNALEVRCTLGAHQHWPILALHLSQVREHRLGSLWRQIVHFLAAARLHKEIEVERPRSLISREVNQLGNLVIVRFRDRRLHQNFQTVISTDFQCPDGVFP